MTPNLFLFPMVSYGVVIDPSPPNDPSSVIKFGQSNLGTKGGIHFGQSFEVQQDPPKQGCPGIPGTPRVVLWDHHHPHRGGWVGPTPIRHSGIFTQSRGRMCKFHNLQFFFAEFAFFLLKWKFWRNSHFFPNFPFRFFFGVAQANCSTRQLEVDHYTLCGQILCSYIMKHARM